MSTPTSGWHSRFPLAIAASCIAAAVWAAPVPEENYVFVPNIERWVSITRHGSRLFGKLDDAGNFVQEFKRSASKGGSEPESVQLNTNYQGTPQTVYEYRSGRLIKGELTPQGDFVPELGSKVIRFEDYKYRPDGVIIWNLPGYFKKVENGKEAKDDKK
jgi:hypothetical protein